MFIMILFVTLAFALLVAMAIGQLRVAYRAIHDGKAGFAKFVYVRDEAPLQFWLMVVAEWLGFALLFVYGLVMVTKVVFA